jgi:ubiquitin carboxyl-terminal hydrolase 16/45
MKQIILNYNILDYADSTKGEQVCQKENNVHGILQTQEDNISCSELSLELIEVPHKTARVGDLFLLSQQEILAEAKENTSTVQFTPEDKGTALSRNFICGYEDINSLASIEHCLAFNFKVEEVEWHCDNCAKVSEETGSGRPVKGSASSSTTNEESDHDGKAEKRIDMSIVHDSQSASIPPNRRKQIDLNIADQMREDQNEQEDRKGHADMSIVHDSQNASIPPNRRKQIDLNIAYQMREDQNEQEDREGHADMSIIHDSQNASIPPNRRKQIDLNIAYQMREDQNEQEDREGHAYKAVVISKLPPVLTVHLKRFETVNDNQIKVPGHVSFDENLDVGQVMDPRY